MLCSGIWTWSYKAVVLKLLHVGLVKMQVVPFPLHPLLEFLMEDVWEGP